MEAWADWAEVHSGYSEEATPFVHACIHSLDHQSTEIHLILPVCWVVHCGWHQDPALPELPDFQAS